MLELFIKKKLSLKNSTCIVLFCFSNFLSTTCFKVPKFSTKTPYHWVLNFREMKAYQETLPEGFDKCVPVHLNYLIRHGAREPSAKDVKKFSSVATKVQNNLKLQKEQRFHSLTEWSNRFIGNDKELVELGREEQYDLGSRIGKRFKSVLSKFQNDGLRFVVSKKSRTRDSALAFYNGLMPSLELDVSAEEGMISSISDDTLRFFDNCRKYLSHVDNNKTASEEYRKFLNGSLMQRLAEKVSTRLDGAPLTPGDVRIIHYMCSLETAFYGKSDWCQVLQDDDLPIIEYLLDLKHYWKKAYGYDINFLQSCPLTDDIFTTIKEAVEKYETGQKYTTGLFRFAHAETILPLYAILGLYKDEIPLRADNYHLHGNRQFFTSHICPFSANIGFVVYDCSSELSKTNERFWISVLVNEEAIILPGQKAPLFPLSEFKRLYSHISPCQFDKVCLHEEEITSPKDEL